MKRVILILISVVMLAGAAYAIDKTASFTWEQTCVDGCPNATPPVGAVTEWRVYMSDTSGVYGETPIITMPYDGTANPTYNSSYVLTLTGAGVKYFVVRSYNPELDPPESGNSNEENYPYNFAGSAIPVNLNFTISTPGP